VLENEDNNVHNKLIQECSKFLAENTEKVKRILTTAGLDVNKRDIKPTAPKVVNNKLAQLIKVSVCDCPYDKVMLFLTAKPVLDLLETEGMFIHDVDFTRDYKGVFNKTKLISYLIQHGFGLQGLNLFGSKATILDNDKLVSRNCLTFIRETDNGTVRYKFYNKFVQSMESPSVRRNIGSHIADWCNNPEKELKEAISKSLDTGLLRLEITFYRLGTDKLLINDFIQEQMDFLKNAIPPHLLYYNSIPAQYSLLLEHVQNNICIVDTDKHMGMLSYFLNK
jgi:hypothetical protein